MGQSTPLTRYLISDETAFEGLTPQAVTNAGIKFTTEYNIAEALYYYESIKPCISFTAILAPILSSDDLLAQLQSACAAAPLVVISGDSTETSIRIARKIGDHVTLSTPVLLTDIISHLEGISRSAQVQHEIYG